MRIVRHIVALASAAFLVWASVVDNPAVCSDEASDQAPTGHRHETPPTSHCCLAAPCHTPTMSRAAVLLQVPASVALSAVPTPTRVLHSIDAPVPPTPPPTLVG